jgi:alpha-D-xyloside xylohydrolase
VRFVGLALLCVLLLAPAAARAEVVVDAGDVRADVTESPFRMRFVDRSGREVLAGRGLGVRTASGSSSATRVRSASRSGGRWTGVVETSDGAAIDVRIEPDGEGALRVTATSRGGALATNVAFATRAGERYLGFGERSDAVDQRGREVQNYVAEGAYQPDEASFITAFIPPWGFRNRSDATYFPMPWMLSTRGYGVLLDNFEESAFRLGTDRPDTWSAEALADRLRFRVLAGPRPADVLKRLTARIGRQPAPAAPWQLGTWFHTGQENVPPADRERAAVTTQRADDVPVSAVETHLRYLPCGAAEVGERRANERTRTAFFHANGLAAITYLNPEVCQPYAARWDEGAAKGLFQRTAGGAPYLFDAFVGDRSPPQTPVSQIDFSNPGAQAYWDSIAGEAVADGHDGWMEDFGEYTPPDSVSANGETGATMHNRYPLLYHRAGYDFARRQKRPLVRHQRSGWTGTAPDAQIVWGGDPTTDWGFDGLRSAVRNGLTMGLSGIGIWGSDIGGYFSLDERRLTPELLKRWVQFGAVSGVMRTKFAGTAVPGYTRPQVFDKGQLPNWKRYAKLRTQLYPYIAGALREYRRTGMPLMRQLALAYPADERATGRDDEFLFGPDLLAAPVLKPGARSRALYLPSGTWLDFWKAVAYDRRGGALSARRAKPVRGGRALTVRAPLEQLPLVLRAGAILPLLPPDVDTLAGYGTAKGLVKLRDRRDAMRILAFPRGTTSTTFGEDGERIRSVEGRRALTLSIDGRRSRSYDVEISLGALRRPFTPDCVELDEGDGGRWQYDGGSKVLSIAGKGRAVRILLAADC